MNPESTTTTPQLEQPFIENSHLDQLNAIQQDAILSLVAAELPLGQEQSRVANTALAVGNLLGQAREKATSKRAVALGTVVALAGGIGASEIASAQSGSSASDSGEPIVRPRAADNHHYPDILGPKMVAARKALNKKCLPKPILLNRGTGTYSVTTNKNGTASLPVKVKSGSHQTLRWTYKNHKRFCGALVTTATYGGYTVKPTKMTKTGGSYRDPAAYGDKSGNQISSVVVYFK